MGGKLPIGTAQKHKDCEVVATSGYSWYVIFKFTPSFNCDLQQQVLQQEALVFVTFVVTMLRDAEFGDN